MGHDRAAHAGRGPGPDRTGGSERDAVRGDLGGGVRLRRRGGPPATLPLAAGSRYPVDVTADATADVDTALEVRCDLVTTTDGVVGGNGTGTDSHVGLPTDSQTVDVATVAVVPTISSVALTCQQVTTDDPSDVEAVTMGSIEVTATANGSRREMSAAP